LPAALLLALAREAFVDVLHATLVNVGIAD
jgi:hypothetical protein